MRSGFGREELRDRLAAVARLGLELDEVERVVARQALRVVGVAGVTHARHPVAERDDAQLQRITRRRYAALRAARVGAGVPQLFEVVVRAHRGLHDVDDDVAAVDEHPFAGLLAFDADDRGAGLLELVAHVVGERLHLPVGVGAGDDQRVVETGELADVEDLDVAGLDVLEGGDGGLLQLVKSHPGGADRVKVVLVNIGQNGGREQFADRRAPVVRRARVARVSRWRRSAAA